MTPKRQAIPPTLTSIGYMSGARTLAAGPADAMHLDSASRQEHPDAMPTTPQVQEGLDAIAKAVEDVNASERALRWLVAVTKHQGATWQQIGDVLGVSRQSAQERFGKDVES